MLHTLYAILQSEEDQIAELQTRVCIMMHIQAGNSFVGCNVSMEPCLLIERTQ